VPNPVNALRNVAASSYLCGPSNSPLIYATVDGVLRSAALRWPDAPALVVRHQGLRFTYGEFDSAVDRLARGFVACGLAPGERIGIWSPNCAEWVLTMFAAARAGLVLVNVNPAYRLGELEFALRHTGCSALLVARSFKSSNYIRMLRELLPELDGQRTGFLPGPRLPQLRTLVQLSPEASHGFISIAELNAAGDAVNSARVAELTGIADPDAPFNIQFTSGTTGLPKGATLTHFNLVNNGNFVGEALGLTVRDSLCVPVPMYHCFGMVMGVLAAVTHGSAVVLPSEAFEPVAVLEAIAVERCTALYGVPTMFIAQLDHPRFPEFDLGSLRTGIMAGAPCPPTLMRRVVDDMHMRDVTICYGMTETSPVSFQSTANDPLDRRVNSVGRIHPHIQAKVIDESGRIVPLGTPGELCTRGYSVMRGYWEDPERTREVLDEAGWMHTGDLAVVDQQGYCSIVGRIKDMIIRGGENISPREVEEHLCRHPQVLDVAVVGVPSTKYGEEVCACIRLGEGAAATADEIREFCRGQIAHFKIPRYVVFLDSLPMTVTGKVQKFVLREKMSTELGLGSA
jgi:fatty-acyl-CoA synthase